MTRSMKARRLFPCFIAVDEVPPLVIGDADLLQPKIRLLLKFAPTIDLVTDAPLAAGRDDDRPVRVIEGVPCRQAHDLIVGRPLVTLDTQDAALNMSRSTIAWPYNGAARWRWHRLPCSAFSARRAPDP